MSIVESSLLGWLIVLVWSDILFLFKKCCLDKVENGFLKYMLGMVFAHSLVLLLYITAMRISFLRTVLQNWRFGIIYGPPGALMLFIIPGFYSIFLIGKGYFNEGGNQASWEWKLKMMASLFFNGFATLFGLLWVYLLLQGTSFSELVFIIRDSFQYMDWWGMLAFAASCILLVFVMWVDHKKCHSI
ncbi:hypothetical protein [Atopobium fossor]|uniref:hypothetical protein n=1 Tax=Atopobium fossor TaxID=39487 RepID=UPI0004876104|nr:hypothetical protein [Atopobium fossor]